MHRVYPMTLRLLVAARAARGEHKVSEGRAP